jgi:hypothetical protein
LTEPGLDLRKAFGFVRDEVMRATNNRQEPFIYGSLGGDDVALVRAETVTPAATSTADPNATVRRDYELALQIGTQAVGIPLSANIPSAFTVISRERKETSCSPSRSDCRLQKRLKPPARRRQDLGRKALLRLLSKRHLPMHNRRRGLASALKNLSEKGSRRL